MTEYVQVVLIANVFRVLCLLAGFGFAYLGYRLYVIGVFEKAQELKAAFGKANLTVKQVAPGIVFGFAGIIIAALGVVRPVTIERQLPIQSTVGFFPSGNEGYTITTMYSPPTDSCSLEYPLLPAPLISLNEPVAALSFFPNATWLRSPTNVN